MLTGKKINLVLDKSIPTLKTVNFGLRTHKIIKLSRNFQNKKKTYSLSVAFIHEQSYAKLAFFCSNFRESWKERISESQV